MTSQAMTTTYVSYQRPGILFAEEKCVKLVGTRDPQQQAIDAPEYTFGFFYFDVITTIVDVEGERIEARSDRRNISKTFYIDAQLFDYAAVSALPGDNTILLRNMRNNGLDSVLRCRTGNFQPFDPANNELVTTN